MMLFKIFQEFSQYFILCTFSSFDIRVETCIKLSFQVVYSEFSVAIEVKIFENSHNNLLSKLRKRAFDNSYKFVKVDDTISRSVKRLEKSFNIFIIYVKTEIVDSFGKLILVKRSWIVVVHNFENSTKTD